MKKQFILVGLLAAGFASAQTDKDYLGKVGINIMTPQATIDIRPNDDNRQETATTNEGILIPKLSKTRVANIKDALLVEGTLVYVTDDASSRIASYTGTNAKVANVTEKGYYYYNGTVWVRAEGIAGKTVLNGTTAPATTIGTVGDFYIDTATNMIYGPKTASGWGTGKSLVGPRGAQGVPGATGAQGPMGPTGPQGPSGVVAATNGVTYDANTKTVSLPAGTSGQVLKWNGTAWAPAADANNTYAGSTSVALSGNSFQRAALTGDVTAAANSNATTVARIQGRAVANTAPTNGQVLKWNGTAWAPATDSGLTLEVDGIVGNEVLNATANKGLVRAGDGTAASPYTLGLADGTANGQVMKWNATTNTWAPAADANTTYVNSTSNTISGNQIQRAALTGDVTAAANSNATTIAPNAVTSAKIADGQVALADLAANSVDSSKIVDKSIVAADLNQMGATDGQVLKYNAATNSWAPAADANTADTSIYANNGTLTGARTVNQNGNNLMFTGAGNIGVGTATPTAKLDVNGTTRISNNSQWVSNQIAVLEFSNGSRKPGATAQIIDQMNGGGDGGDNLLFTTQSPTPGVNPNLTEPTEKMRITAAGNVGIGTTIPTAKLDVAGNMRVQVEGGNWLTGKTGTQGITSATKLTDAYHPFLRQETKSGHFVNIGGMQDNFGFYGYLADRTTNGYDHSFLMNLNTGNIGINANPDTTNKLYVNGSTRIQSLSGIGDRVVLADATGVLKTGTLPTTSISGAGNLTGTGITVGNGAGATLKNVTLAIADNAITSAKIQDGQVATADLANGAVTAAKLNAMGATDGQVLKYNATTNSWAPAADANTNTTYTGSTSVALSGNSFQRAALTGDVTAAANSNATTIAPNAVTSAKIADGQVALADLAANSVDSSKIVDKSIVAADLNQMGATDGQVLKYNAATNSWAPAADANTNTTYTAGNGIAISGTTISLSTPIKTVTAAYTLAVADNNGYVYVNSARSVTVTVPSALPAGFSCVVVQKGTGQVTIVAGAGTNYETARGTKTRARYSAVGIIKDTASTFTITGDAIY